MGSSFVFREKLSHHSYHSHQSLQQQRLLQYHQHRQLLLIGRGFFHTQSDGSTNSNHDNDGVVCIVDYFKLFDLQRKFGIPLPELKKRYLMDMMEWRERIENAVGNDDSSSSSNNNSGDNKK